MGSKQKHDYTIELPDGKIENKNSTAIFTHALICQTATGGFWFTWSLHRSEALARNAVTTAYAQQANGWYTDVATFESVAITRVDN